MKFLIAISIAMIMVGCATKRPIDQSLQIQLIVPAELLEPPEDLIKL